MIWSAQGKGKIMDRVGKFNLTIDPIRCIAYKELLKVVLRVMVQWAYHSPYTNHSFTSFLKCELYIYFQFKFFVAVIFHFYKQYRYCNTFTQQDITHTILAFFRYGYTGIHCMQFLLHNGVHVLLNALLLSCLKFS